MPEHIIADVIQEDLEAPPAAAVPERAVVTRQGLIEMAQEVRNRALQHRQLSATAVPSRKSVPCVRRLKAARVSCDWTHTSKIEPPAGETLLHCMSPELAQTGGNHFRRYVRSRRKLT